jgi:hypothetical protein
MRAMLGEGHADRRELSDLMATKPQSRLALIGSELMTAAAARIRVVINDLIDLILGLSVRDRHPDARTGRQPCAQPLLRASVPSLSSGLRPAAAPVTSADPTTAASN